MKQPASPARLWRSVTRRRLETVSHTGRAGAGRGHVPEIGRIPDHRGERRQFVESLAVSG